jgi:hypothetical protein
MIPLPIPGEWPGASKRYLSRSEKTELLAGRPFEILAAVQDHGVELDCAYLLRFIDSPEIDSAVWTRHASPSRVRLVRIVQEAVVLGETVGPLACELIPSTKPDQKPFASVTNWHPPAEVHGGGGEDFGDEETG